MPIARASAPVAATHGPLGYGSNASMIGAAAMPKTAAPQVTVSGSKHVRASTSAPAIINAPSTVDATAMGHGSDNAETTATAADPPMRIATFGRRSAPDSVVATTSLISAAAASAAARRRH